MAPYIAHHLCNHSPVCTLDRLKFAEKKPKKLPVLIDTYSLWANSRIHFVNFQYLKYCNNSSILYLLFSFSERRLQQVFQKKFVLLRMNFGCQFHWIDGMGFFNPKAQLRPESHLHIETFCLLLEPREKIILSIPSK